VASLFEPIRLGTLELRNRIAMAPMTRRSHRPDCPAPMLPIITVVARKEASD
jgi:2,4-dienoyl-CoA reductase-like NADH-dependent reductase (Old Yellow Enzyme family)